MICCPYCITSCLMPAVDFGNCGKPIASRALRKSFSVTNTWNDKASHSVMQLNTARKVCSLFVIRNFFIGPGQVKVIMDDEVDGFSCGFSIFFSFSTLTLRICFRCSCRPFVNIRPHTLQPWCRCGQSLFARQDLQLQE